jgi:hypothetical protein
MMMLNIKAKLQKVKNRMIALRYIKTLTPEDLQMPKWLALSAEYQDQETDMEQKVIITILNSAFLQDRVVFLLSRSSLRHLVSQDKNWKRVGFTDANYSRIRDWMHNGGVFRCLRDGTKDKKASVWEIIDPDCLQLIQINTENQRLETIAAFESYTPHQDPHQDPHGEGEYEYEPEYKGRGGLTRRARSPLKTISPQSSTSPVGSDANDGESMEDWCKRMNQPFIQGNQ